MPRLEVIAMGVATIPLVAERASDSIRRAWERRVRVRPTGVGIVYSLLLVAVVAAAANTGNNLVYMVLGCMLAALVISNALGEWNLRGVYVRRRLPPDLFAGEPARGEFVVENRRRWGPAVSVRVTEAGGADGLALWVPAGGTAAAPAAWTFARRGTARLARVRITSAFPFGLVRRWREVDLTAEVLVYPTPAAGAAPPAGSGSHGARGAVRRRGRGHEFLGLRPYDPGDPLRDLHWPTTARVGEPMVAVRVEEAGDEAVVDVPDAAGEAWERNLSRACAAVLVHVRRRRAVGLRMGGRTWPARTGDPWRRRLLGALAGADRR